MKRSWWVPAWGLVIALAAANLVSCGHDQKLVSVQIHPSNFTFLTADPGQTEQLTAFGTYIHPPATKDVTNLATWSVDDGVVNVSGGTVTTPGGSCGGADITATLPEGTGGSSNIIVGFATITVDDPTNPLCPGGGKFATVSVSINPANGGTVTSSPGGINCPTQCVGTFSVGASVTLTAAPAGGFAFANWTNCAPASGNPCTVNVPTGGVAVVATFQ